MGYETRHTLSWSIQSDHAPKPNCPHVFSTPFCPECGRPKGTLDPSAEIAEYIEANDEMSYALEPDGSEAQPSKWYNHETDMRAMSEAFPGILFKLHGKGEESGDIWDAYYLNGKSQEHKARIVIDPMNPKDWK